MAHFKSSCCSQAQCWQRIAILARFPRFCWVWNCARVCFTCRDALFSENSKSYVILEVFAGFELLRSCCFFFWAVPCALEAQTVINTSCFDWRFPRKREKVRQ